MKTLFVCLIILASALGAEPVIHLKKRQLQANADLDAYRAAPLKRRHTGSSHFLIDFGTQPTREQMQELRSRGFRITSFVPDSALVVAGPDQPSWDGLNLRYIGRLDELDKLSKLLAAHEGESYVVVEFHPDVTGQDMRALVLEANLHINERASLLPSQLLVGGDLDQIERLAAWDEVAYIFPASKALIGGEPAIPCHGAVTEEGPIAQYVKQGPGWSPTGPQGSALALSYVIGQLTEKLPPETAKAEIERALNEWAKNSNVTFTVGDNAAAPRTVNIFFGEGDHGDPYPFDGAGRVLAHTFYPPPNAEPTAGDMHLDGAESWSTGGSVDLFSVVLHEAGHALGLAHSDNPSAVMYPFYRTLSGLNADDIAGVESLYGVAHEAPPQAPAEQPTAPQEPVAPAPAINVTTPAFTTASSAVTISGTASGKGALRITWVNDRGGSGVASGSASWFMAVALSAGVNHITVMVTDELYRTASQTAEIALKIPDVSDTIAPTMVITAPGTAMIYTAAATISLSGTAADNVGVAGVSWTNSFGNGGDAAGTTSWRIAGIPLLVGTNKIAVKAYDAAGNSVVRRIMVVRR